MAASLSRWLNSALLKATSQAYNGDQEPFLRGSKVQILAFLGFNGTANRSEKEEDGLWAVVADREFSICVHFTAECVRYFDSTHTRPLLSLRGSIVGLKWYRPQVSCRAARMFAIGNDASSSGPFAQAENASFRTFLEVESIQLWGSINAPTFFDSADLQFSLIQEASEGKEACSRAFVRWFGNAVSMAYRARSSIRGTEQRKAEKESTNQNLAPTSPVKQSEQVLDRRESVLTKEEGDSERDALGDDEFGIVSAADRVMDRDQGIKHSLLTDGAELAGDDPDVLTALNDENINGDELDRWRSSDLIEVPPVARKRKRDSESGLMASGRKTHEGEAIDQVEPPAVQVIELPPTEGSREAENWSDVLV